jgi:hypothetical protein
MPLNPASGGYFPDLPVTFAPVGIRTPYGVILPPGSQIAAYVRNDGANGTTFVPKTGDDAILNKLGVGTLSQALARVRSGAGDTVVMLPGHLENCVDNTMLTNLIAGTNIFGIPQGSLTPTIRWTNTAGNWVFNKNDVSISGLRLRMEGANGITQAINWTGADCSLIGCDIEVASGAALKATIAIELSNATAARALISKCRVRGTDTHNVTNGILVSAAVDQLEISDCRMQASATAANGLINVTAAATNLYFSNLHVANTMTSSTAAINLGNVALTGMCCDVYTSTLNNGTVTSQGIILGASSLIRLFQCFSNDEPNKSGALQAAAAT